MPVLGSNNRRSLGLACRPCRYIWLNTEGNWALWFPGLSQQDLFQKSACRLSRPALSPCTSLSPIEHWDLQIPIVPIGNFGRLHFPWFLMLRALENCISQCSWWLSHCHSNTQGRRGGGKPRNEGWGLMEGEGRVRNSIVLPVMAVVQTNKMCIKSHPVYVHNAHVGHQKP